MKTPQLKVKVRRRPNRSQIMPALSAPIIQKKLMDLSSA